MIPHPPDGWPHVCEPADPWAGEEWLADRGSFENHRLVGGELDRETHDQLDAAWLDGYFQVLRGERKDTSLDPLSRSLRLIGPRSFDKRHPLVAPFGVSDRQIADIVEDYVPDCGLIAADRFLGPWADEAPARALVRAAAIHLAWLPLLDENGTPAGRWYGSNPKPPIPIRRAVQAVHKAPPLLWTPTWQPLMPVSQHWEPQGPVSGQVVPLAGPVKAILARVTPTENGWHANGAIGLPAVPPVGALLRRLELELLRRRRHERRTTWEVLLRLRPEVLFRFCTTWIWEKT